MIKAVIIDDEAKARELLTCIIQSKYSDLVEIIGEADDVNSGINLIRSKLPDLAFIDIQMPDGSGFEIVEKTQGFKTEFIFATAYDKYALKAFECSAFGYLMKPINFMKLGELILRFKDQMDLLSSSRNIRLKVLVENYSDKKVHKIVVKGINGFTVLELDRIYHLVGDGSYTRFVTIDSTKVVASKNLGTYEKLLEDYGFFRIHQGSLVNLALVQEYSTEDGGTVVMKNGDELKLARKRRAEFIKKFI